MRVLGRAFIGTLLRNFPHTQLVTNNLRGETLVGVVNTAADWSLTNVGDWCWRLMCLSVCLIHRPCSVGTMRRFTYSSPSDMKQRHKLRGSVRRDQYGTVELVVSIDQGGKIKNIGRFRVEPAPDVDYVCCLFVVCLIFTIYSGFGNIDNCSSKSGNCRKSANGGK